jgi:hypothetical protein
MRRFAAILFLMLFSTLAWSADKPNPADYTIKVHISATHIRHFCSERGADVRCDDGIYADAILNGKKIELLGGDVIDKKVGMLIIPGDYPVRLTKDIHNADSTAIRQEYDILLPDGTVWHCVTTGISE